MADKSDLVPDCDNCAALCCVAPYIWRSTSFAFEKPAGNRCRHLGSDYRCRIHDDLSAQGFQGCVDYQCYGAGQKVTQQIYGFRTWLSHPELAERIFRTYFIVKSLHELLSYLNEAAEICHDPAVCSKIEELRIELESLTTAGEEALYVADINDHKKRVQILIADVGVTMGQIN
tara:strand:+ start:134 stop:655 length:522 start_codon:yes stop_codon:yes gene_type:complete